MKKKRKLNELKETKIEDEVMGYKTTFNVETKRHEITWEDREKIKEEERQKQLRQVQERNK